MDYRTLGNSGLTVSRYCFGSLTLGPLCAALSIAEGGELLLSALQQGVSFIDSAEQYSTYPYIRYALERFDRPDQVVVASKTFAETDQQAAWAVEDARLALRRNRLDIMLLHEVRDREDWESRAAAWQLLRQLKEQGVITALGLSTHSAAVAAWAAREPEIDIIHAMMNMAGIGVLDGNIDDMLAALRQAKQAGKGVYTMKALAGGALSSRAEQALKWALAIDDADAVAVGCRAAAELSTNLAWLEGREATQAAQISALERTMVFDKEPRCHGCGRCVEKCPNNALYLANNTAMWRKENCLFCGYCIAACPWFCISFC